jgi:hypothetical protein
VVTPAVDESNFDSLVKNLSDKLQMNQAQASGLLSTSNSTDLLSISPIFGKTFDAESIDSLSTPADDDLIKGIRNINYDIDFSDSPENSLAEEIAEIRKYAGIASEVAKTTEGGGVTMSKSDLEEFDPLMSKDKQEPLENNLTRSLIDDSPNDLLLENPLLPLRNDYRGFSSQLPITSISCETGTPPTKN